MKHRHLVDDAGLIPAAIDDILDRGDPADWRSWDEVLDVSLRLGATLERARNSRL